MPKKSLLLIIFLTAVTVIFVFFAIKSQDKTGQNTQRSTSKTAEKSSLLSFAPTSVSVTNFSAPTRVDITVDSNNEPITGVQLEMTYDPKVLTNVSIVAPADSLFGPPTDFIVLFKNIDTKNGRISYAIATTPKIGPKKGKGKVAMLVFTPVKNPSINSSKISFVEKTLVTSPYSKTSVLKGTVPLSITF